jgi:hypothetical protein
MLLLHRLSRRQHPFFCVPWMDFRFEQTSFDDWIVLSQLGSLLRSHPVAMPQSDGQGRFYTKGFGGLRPGDEQLLPTH